MRKKVFDLELEGNILIAKIKRASWFPFKTGRLKYHATNGFMMDSTTYVIKFSSHVAPYVEYLEEGTKEHNIPRAFGRPLPFGTKGRFNGKFHPGSTKHKGFIPVKCVQEIIDYFVNKYNGRAEEIK